MSNKFNVGDNVRLVNILDLDGHSYFESSYNTIGNVGIVTSVDAADDNPEELPYSVHWTGIGTDGYHAGNLEHIGEESCEGKCTDE